MLFAKKAENENNESFYDEKIAGLLRSSYESGNYELCLHVLRDNSGQISLTAPHETFICSLIELHLLSKLGLMAEASEITTRCFRLADLELELFKEIKLDFSIETPVLFFEDIFSQLYALSHPGIDKNTNSDYIDDEVMKLPLDPEELTVHQIAHYVFFKEYYLVDDIFYNEFLPLFYSFALSEDLYDSVDEFLGLYVLDLIARPQRCQDPDSKNCFIMLTEARLIRYYFSCGNREMIIKIGSDLLKYTLPEEIKKHDLFLEARYNYLFAVSAECQGKTDDIELFNNVVNAAMELFPDIVEQYHENNGLIFDSGRDIDTLYTDYLRNVEEGRLSSYYPVENLYYYIKGSQGKPDENSAN